MRILRSSIFVSMTDPPMTVVVRDIDITDTLESAAISSVPKGALVTHDIFEVPEGTTIQRATRLAMGRMDQELEHNMAICFFWAMHKWSILRPKGNLFMDRPAPLSPEDMRYVFDQLRQQPSYREFDITGFAQDGTMVRLIHGEVE